MRNMSFAFTTVQFGAQTKTVTRRLGWKDLKPGEVLMGCVKCMGLRKGENVQKLGLIRVVSVCREPLSAILEEPEGCAKEGFPRVRPEAFVAMFCEHNRCKPETEVTRIEYEYLEYPKLAPLEVF